MKKRSKLGPKTAKYQGAVKQSRRKVHKVERRAKRFAPESSSGYEEVMQVERTRFLSDFRRGLGVGGEG